MNLNPLRYFEYKERVFEAGIYLYIFKRQDDSVAVHIEYGKRLDRKFSGSDFKMDLFNKAHLFLRNQFEQTFSRRLYFIIRHHLFKTLPHCNGELTAGA